MKKRNVLRGPNRTYTGRDTNIVDKMVRQDEGK